jgi:flagellum-specific peptidoglycan hydrolase FlgJ
MIIVPIEENHSGLASATDAKFRTPDMSGSGLEALGAGLAKLGDGGQQFATALDEKRRRELAAEIAAAHLDDHHQRNLDDAAAKKAYVDYSDQSAAMLHGENGILNHAGAEAHAAFPTLVAALADAHDEAMAPLDSVQCAIVGPALGERLRSDVARAAAHVRQQGEVEQHVQSRALQTVAARDAVAHADQPDLHDHHMATGENAIRQQAMIGGTPDDERDQQLADYRSGVHADTIEALAARDPASAADWYGRYGGELNEFDRQRIKAALDSALTGTRPTESLTAAAGRFPTADQPAANEMMIRPAAYLTGEAEALASDTIAEGGSGTGNADDPSRMKVFKLMPPIKAPTGGKKTLTARDRAFLEKNYAPALAVAQKYHVDVNLLLGVAALESKWSTSIQARFQNNPIGATPDGSTPVSYPTIAAAWEAWGKQWGPRIVGVGDDAGLFTTRLLTDNRKAVGAVDRRGRYNSVTPAAWKKQVMDTAESVRRRMARWDGAAR